CCRRGAVVFYGVAPGAARKTADPMLRRVRFSVADEFGARSGAGHECVEGFEREIGEAVLDLQRQQARPGDADVEAVVGLAARGGGEIVAGARLKSDMPVFGVVTCGASASSPLTSRPKSLRAAAGAFTLSRTCRTIGMR